MEIIIIIIGAIISAVIFDEMFDALVWLIKTVLGPLLGGVGLVFFIAGCSNFHRKGSGSVIAWGLVLMLICFFRLGGWIVDAVLAIIGISILLFAFSIIWMALEGESIILRFIVSVGTTIFLVAISPILAFIPFLNIEGSMISNASKSVYRIESKIASNFSKSASNIEGKIISGLEEIFSKNESKAITEAKNTLTKDAEKAARQIDGKKDIGEIKKTSPKNILSKENKASIMANTGWSSKIVDSIGSEIECEIYQKAKLQERIVNGKNCLVTKVNWNKTDQYGRTNRERGKLGLAPLDENGNPLELHHIGQKENSPLAELTMQEHRGKGNDNILHDKTKETEIDRAKFANERIEHWEARATEGD